MAILHTSNYSEQFTLPLHCPRHFLSFQGSEDHYICNCQNEVNESNSQRLHSNTQKVCIQKTKINSCRIFPPFLPPPIVWDMYSQNYSDIKYHNILTARYIAAYTLSAASLDGNVFLAFMIRSGFPVQACALLMNCVYCLHPSAV